MNYWYVDVGFSFCLISNYIKDNIFMAMKNRIFCTHKQDLLWQTTWLCETCWKMLYLPILYLLQMVPLDVWRVTPGTKWIVNLCWCRTTYLTCCLMLTQAMQPPDPVVLAWSQMGKGPSDIPWSFLQRFLQIPLCTPHHTATCHTHTYTLLFSKWCYPSAPPGDP